MPAWSYSALQTFESCPRKFQALRITKEVKDEQGPAIIKGNFIHAQFEAYLKAKGQFALPEELKKFRALLDVVLAMPGEKYVEYQVALTRTLQPTTFFGKDCWSRGKLDFLVVNGDTATMLDWKTGKPKSDYSQLKIFALYVFAMFPHVNTVKSGFVWVEGDLKKPVDAYTYTREDVTLMWNEFLPRIKVFEDAHVTNAWPTMPSGLCKAHCPVTSCTHNGNYKA